MPSTLAVLAAGILVHSGLDLASWGALAAKLPSTAQIINQKTFNVLDDVPPPLQANDSTVCCPSPSLSPSPHSPPSYIHYCIWALLTRDQVFLWPGVTQKSLTAKPFHVYDEEFYDVIGKDPSLTLIATSDTDPIFHEAVVW